MYESNCDSFLMRHTVIWCLLPNESNKHINTDE